MSQMVWCCVSVFVFTLLEGSVILPGGDAWWDGLLSFWLTKSTGAAPFLRKGKRPQDIYNSSAETSPRAAFVSADSSIPPAFSVPQPPCTPASSCLKRRPAYCPFPFSLSILICSPFIISSHRTINSIFV